MSMRSEIMLAAAVIGATIPSVASAQATVSLYEEYGKLIQSRNAVATLGNDMFGDQVNLYTGTVEFVQTDVDLSGNNKLRVAVGRRFVPNQAEETNLKGMFADWDLEVPHLHGVFSTAGWIVAGSTTNRCSSFGAPPNATGSQGSNASFGPNEYWHGNFLYIPGSGDEEMLYRPANSATPVPNDGKTYPIVTKSGVAIRCLANLASSSNGQGQGFEAVTPDGTVYRFDHMFTRSAPRISKPDPNAQTSLRASRSSTAVITPMIAPDYFLDRVEVWIVPTLVMDRFGNTVTYNWAAGSAKLNSIVASDGRSLTFTYVTGTSKAATVSDGTRTWIYAYATTLQQVTLPDSSTWTFSMEPIRYMHPYVEGGDCGGAGDSPYLLRTGTMKHPGGAQGSFTIEPRLHGRSWVPLTCVGASTDGSHYGSSLYPAEYLNPTLTKKKITGPGLPTAGNEWVYTYGPANNCYQPGGIWPALGTTCTASSPTTKTVTVTDPEANATRYTFGNRYQVNEGQLLQVDAGWNGSSALRTAQSVYADPAAGPYPNPIGVSPQNRSDSFLGSRYAPLRQNVTIQQGRTFTWQVASDCSGMPYCFDTRARPTKIVKSSSP